MSLFQTFSGISNKTRKKDKKNFCRSCLECFSSAKVLREHKENCVIINGKKSVKLKSGSIKFNNYFKQLAVPFKIYDDFEFLLKGLQSSDENDSSYTEKYQDHILAVLLIKLFVLIINLVKRLCFIGEKIQFIDSLQQFLKSTIIVKT